MGGMSVRVEGAEQLARVAGAATGAGPKFRKELLAGIRKQGKPVITDVKAEAVSTLPAGGGLNDFIAKSSFGVRTRTSGKQAGIRVVATKKNHDIESINKGIARHPLWGNKGHWFNTPVKPGFFDRPIEGRAPEFARGIHVVMDDLLRDIKRESGT